MAIISGVTTLLCAVFALAALTELAAARSVPAEGATYVVETDQTEMVVVDADKFLVETESETDFPDSRAKRLVPTWSCRGAFSSGTDSYDVDCTTNLEVQTVECTLDGSPYNCGGIDFSIDTRNFVSGEEHVLRIRVRARYGNSRGTLSYTFRFRKQVTSNSVSCRSRAEGQNVVITCSGTGISKIEYRLNGGSYTNAQSTTSFTILGSQLREGSNTIGLRITVSGVTRTLSLTAQKQIVAVFSPSCSISYDSSGNAVFVCSHSTSSEAIQSITYTINGGEERTASSVSRFQISADQLLVGDNVVSLTFTSASGATQTLIFTLRKIQVVAAFIPRCSYASDSSGSIAFSCSRGTGTENIRTIRYTINGGSEMTASSVSRFEIRSDQLIVGENQIRVTFVSSSGATRTITYTARKTQTQARSFSVRCSASYNSDGNAEVTCSTNSPDSEPIATITYTVNGRAQQTASSVSGFEVDKSLLTREVNSIVVTLVSSGGLSRDLTLSLVQPLSLRCNSQTTSAGITITCQSNRDSSSITVTCSLDGVAQSNCDLNTDLDFSGVSQGRHIYEVVVTDASGLIVRNQISFENKVTTSCRGSLNLGASVYSVSCVSDRELQYQCFIDGRAIDCPESLQIDLSRVGSGRHVLLLVGTDSSGNTATFTSEFVVPQAIGSCVIDDNAADGVIDWRCTTSVAGVSIVCLVDNIRLEPCLCQLGSEFFTERYPEGEHTVSLILTTHGGSSERFDQVFTVQRLISSSSHAIEPLAFECTSQLREEFVDIDCVSNKEVDLTCYLDDAQYTPCRLTDNHVAFANISQGPHTFAVVAEDRDGLVDRSEVHFEEDLDISCRGSYNPAYDVVHLACDSTRPLASTECQLGDGATTECPTPFDLPVDEFVNDLTLRVSAHDSFGNTDSDELTFLTSSCEGC